MISTLDTQSEDPEIQDHLNFISTGEPSVATEPLSALHFRNEMLPLICTFDDLLDIIEKTAKYAYFNIASDVVGNTNTQFILRDLNPWTTLNHSQ